MAEYIERESILNAIRKTSNLYVDQQGLYLSCELIAAMPAADVQSIKHGRWEYYKNNGIINTYICTNCQSKVEMAIDVEPSKFKYCPNCGARMIKDGEKNEDN